MKLKLLTAIMAGAVWSADNVPASSSEVSLAKRHVSVRFALNDYNQARLDRSKEFEENVGQQKIAKDLPQELVTVLKEKTKGKEFSRREVVQPLFAKINPAIVVTKVDKLEGGFVSGQIYRVTGYNIQKQAQEFFFIKYLRTKPVLVSEGRTYGEQVNLQNLAQAFHLEEIQRHIDIMLPIDSYEYTANKNRKVFMVIPGAKGESFTRIVTGTNLDEVNAAFAKLGDVFGQIHQTARFFQKDGDHKLPTTLRDFINVKVPSHGDLHGDNVFYDKNTGRLSLIDVETMANSFNEDGAPNSPICYDMFYMLLMSSKKFGSFMPENNWAPFLQMFRSYIATYPEAERVGIYDYLIYCLGHTDKIKFTDIFVNFTLDKGFGSTRTAGAQLIAKALTEDKAKFTQPKDSIASHERRFKSRILPKRTGKIDATEVKKAIEGGYGIQYVASSSAPSSPTSSSSSSDTVDVVPVIPSSKPAEPLKVVPKPIIAKPFSDEHLTRMAIQPGQVSILKARWEALATQK